MKISKFKIYFWGAYLFWTIFSITFLIMPFNVLTASNEKSILLIVTGAMFWLCLLGGLVLFLILCYMAKKYKKENIMEKAKRRIPFYSNIPTSIADTCFIAMIFVLFVLWNRNNINGYVTYVVLFILCESIFTQILFGGNIYKVLIKINKNNGKKGEKANENER